MIRLVIADDQLLFRSMLEAVIESDKELLIEAVADDGQEALSHIKRLKPDIALLDIKMPKLSGIEVLKEIKNSVKETKVILLTTFGDNDTIVDAKSLGADGYLVKDLKPEILLMAIKCIHANLKVINSEAFEMMCTSYTISNNDTKRKVSFGDMLFDMTEIAIIKHISEGKTNKEIAKIMNYSEGTIKNKVSNILTITGLTDRTKISIFAIKNNII